MDLQDRQQNTRDGLHMASRLALDRPVRLRRHAASGHGCHSARGCPRASPGWPSVSVRDRTLQLTITPDEAKYELVSGSRDHYPSR